VITYDGEMLVCSKKPSFEKKRKRKREQIKYSCSVSFPNIAFGNTAKLNQETLLFKKRNGLDQRKKRRVLLKTDVLVKNGKIAAIGNNTK
jgi:hypothetical protein